MINVVKSYPYKSFDDDLYICEEQGIVYQKDMSKSVAYDEQYFNNYVGRENTEIANKLNKCRVDLSHKYCSVLIDMGIGSGEFITKAHNKVYGFDINEVGITWLKERNLFVDPYKEIPEDVEGWTFWDVIEHIPEPQGLFELIPQGHFLFVSLPIFEDITKVKESKHFKPNEHYYYWTQEGFIETMSDYGFTLIETNEDETVAGREGIKSFAFVKEWNFCLSKLSKKPNPSPDCLEECLSV